MGRRKGCSAEEDRREARDLEDPAVVVDSSAEEELADASCVANSSAALPLIETVPAADGELWFVLVNESYQRLASGADILDVGRELLILLRTHPGSVGNFFRSFSQHTTSRSPDHAQRDVFPLAVPDLLSITTSHLKTSPGAPAHRRSAARQRLGESVAVWVASSLLGRNFLAVGHQGESAWQHPSKHSSGQASAYQVILDNVKQFVADQGEDRSAELEGRAGGPGARL